MQFFIIIILNFSDLNGKNKWIKFPQKLWQVRKKRIPVLQEEGQLRDVDWRMLHHLRLHLAFLLGHNQHAWHICPARKVLRIINNPSHPGKRRLSRDRSANGETLYSVSNPLYRGRSARGRQCRWLHDWSLVLTNKDRWSYTILACFMHRNLTI